MLKLLVVALRSVSENFEKLGAPPPAPMEMTASVLLSGGARWILLLRLYGVCPIPPRGGGGVGFGMLWGTMDYAFKKRNPFYAPCVSHLWSIENYLRFDHPFSSPQTPNKRDDFRETHLRPNKCTLSVVN